MTMEELGAEYRKSAEPIRARLKSLRKALSEAVDPDEIWILKRQINDLWPILRDMNRMGEYCERYYESGFYIQDGPFGRRKRGRVSEAPKQGKSGSAKANNGERVERSATADGDRSVGGGKTPKSYSVYEWRKCFNSKQNLSQRNK